MAKYQVFISSVSRELRQTRQRLQERLLRTGRYFPVAMENFTAHDNTVRMLYAYLQDSDIYVLILKNEAGSALSGKNAAALRELAAEDRALAAALADFEEDAGDGASELTYTQLEYVMARALGLRVLTFVYAGEGGSAEERAAVFGGGSGLGAVMKWMDENDLLDGIAASLETCTSDPKRPVGGWIRRTESPLYRETKRAGILSMSLDGGGFVGKLKELLPGALGLDLFFTTGRGFIVNNQAMLGEFVAAGGDVRLLCARPHQSFLEDVAEVETRKYGPRDDIHQEFMQVISTLGHIRAMAEKQWRDGGGSLPMGRIRVGGAGTMFRSSLMICRLNEKSRWGWLTVTLPPEKSRDMISLELSHTAGRGDGDNLLKHAADHFESVWSTAEARGQVAEIDSRTDFEALNAAWSKKSEVLGNRAYWEEKYKAARSAERRRRGRRILIEVAAQHPLKDGYWPDTEFAARLDEAARLYREETERGGSCEIYVPGSVHLDQDGIPDERSLSAAGVEYLTELGLPPENLHGDDLNDRYGDRAWPGVYNSGDECYVAARYFLEPESSFGSLICVCSPNQVMRKSLFYMENGILAQIRSVPVRNMFHSFLGEIYEAVPKVLTEDPSCQEPDSGEALRTRNERMPGFRKD